MRQRLDSRRMGETFDLNFHGERFHVTVGFYTDGSPGEVFAHGPKVGSALDFLLADVCIAIAVTRQLGHSLTELARVMSRDDDGEPASVAGAIVDLVASLE